MSDDTPRALRGSKVCADIGRIDAHVTVIDVAAEIGTEWVLAPLPETIRDALR